MTFHLSVRRPSLPPNLLAYGFSLRKRPIVRRFVGGADIRFIGRRTKIPAGSAVLVWGSGDLPHGARSDVQIIRVEDGFLRSVGLGADLVRPVSWVIDQAGIYYDATGPSDLERILETTDFTSDMLSRAARLRTRIVESRLTKYNVGSQGWQRPACAARVILVPGQVETDASIRFGARDIRTNLGLLKEVRAANPDAHIVYKPHPDVVAGLRGKGRGEDEVQHWCNEIVFDVAMADMLSAVDEVHVLTSLTGFEALLRCKTVKCYGQPFYAGWGLTEDVFTVERRARRLSLDALVAGALILYPVYIGLSSGRIISPEEALDELLAWREANAAKSDSMWRRGLRVLLRAWGARR